jgi:ElaB/YqjD/DUF883 family membrane-anchored ribosome-binding protein
MDRTYSERGSTATREDEHDLLREIDRRKADLRQLRSDVSTFGGDAARAARAGVRESMNAAGNRARAAAEVVEKQVSEHPYLSLAAAFAVGLALGVRVTRRD